jgi:hypothetical protein
MARRAQHEPVQLVHARRPPACRPSDGWILAHHDAWSRATLSTMFGALAAGCLDPDQFARWLLDRASIARALVHACARVQDMLGDRLELPALAVAHEEADWLEAYAAAHGLDIHSKFKLSYQAQRLVDLIDVVTAPGAGVCAAVTAPWCFLMTSWQACSLSRRGAPESGPVGLASPGSSTGGGRGPNPTHVELRNYLSRDATLVRIVETQSVLDSLLNVTTQHADFSKAQKTFEDVLALAVGTLDRALESSLDSGRAPLCDRCGRKGHTGERCTFKSHV